MALNKSNLKNAIIFWYAKVLAHLRPFAWKFWIHSILAISAGVIIYGVIAGKPKVSLFIISEDINDLQILIFRRNQDGLLHPEPLFQDIQPFDLVEGLVNINPHLDLAKESKILIHGWKTSVEYAERFIHDYLEAGDYNVIVIDWSRLATWDSYTTSAANSILVGDHVGNVFAQLLSAELVHVVGHSLGAHAAGHFGRRFTAITGRKIKRISGLDPAKHWFDLNEEFGFHLTKHDAQLVDVIHTNSGELWEGCYSWPDQLGHIDFYPNGGEHQPGCVEAYDLGLSDLGGCSHDRAIDYFIESINSKRPFYAQRCSNWVAFDQGHCEDQPIVVMGENLQESLFEGKYYLRVNENTPYAY